MIMNAFNGVETYAVDNASNDGASSSECCGSSTSHSGWKSGGVVKLHVLVQPDNVQVKRVGRASLIEPGIKLGIECDACKVLVINAYLRVQGSDNRCKNIPLQKSDEIIFNKSHRAELLPMKLRFLKTLKVQMLKRNLGVSRPEGCIVLEAINRDSNEVEAITCTTDFAIISDPRYLEEVKKKRASTCASGKTGCSSNDHFGPVRARSSKRKQERMNEYYAPNMSFDREDPEYIPAKRILANGVIVKQESDFRTRSGCSASSDSSEVDCMESSCGSATPSPIAMPDYLRRMSCSEPLRCSQESLCADTDNSEEEEWRLAKLIQGLKYHEHIVDGCRFLPHAA